MAHSIDTSDWHILEVCEDCYLGINGYTEDELGYSIETNMSDMASNWPDHDIVPSQESSEDHTAFSSRDCDTCDSALAGSRYEATAIPER